MTNGSRATGPEPFYHKRGEQYRSGQAVGMERESSHKAVGMWAIEPLRPFGGLRVTPHAPGVPLSRT